MIALDLGAVVLGARSWGGGDRVPVLLVHGLSSNARLWDGVAAHLAALGHPVVAVDLRGHGRSADVTEPEHGAGPTLTAAADVASCAAALGWERAVVAGQSWGGNVAVQLAADHPELVGGLALVDGGWLHLGASFAGIDEAWAALAPPVFDGLTAVALRARLRESHPDWWTAAIDATMASLEELPDATVRPWLARERHREILASMVEHRPRTLYPKIRCRCLLLVADRSRPGPDEAVGLLPDAELVEFPGGDHDLHAQHPDRVAELIAGLA